MNPLKKRLSSSTAMIALAIVPAAANATNGYFAHGYSVRSKAMAGTGVAFSQDAVAPAINPSGPTGERPIKSSEVLFNILAPSVQQRHINGVNPLSPGQSIELSMTQFSLQLAWLRRF